jgi:hypothetical protein
MGLDVPSIQLLCCAKSMGVDFSDTMMVGRQTINTSPAIAASIMNKIGISPRLTAGWQENQFAEPLFRLLGAAEVSSLDISSYQGTSHLHDLNKPLPPHLREKFTVVHDGGTIEHVFNIPQAFKNCMEMVRVGGHFIQVNVANNYMGHGFWQFCPELIYRVFSAENGFRTRIVLMHETDVLRQTGASYGAWYAVSDPASCHSRVELVNTRPTYICTIAERISVKEPFTEPPQQSDYVVTWKGQPPAPPQSFSVRQLVPRPIKQAVRWTRSLVTPKPSPFDRPYYHQLSDDDVVRGRVGSI